MASYSEVHDTNINLENINVYKKINDETNEHVAYVVRPAENYVMHDTTDNSTETVFNEETGETTETPVKYYSTYVMCPKTQGFDSFTWKAVLRSSIDEKYIL